jgi:hypothetical protein
VTTIAEELAAARSLYQELDEFVREVLATQDSVSVEKLVRMAHRHFNGDEWIREALVREGLNAMIPKIAGQVRHDLRTSARRSNSPEGRLARIASVFEHTGDGTTKSVLALTRPEHQFVVEERTAAILGHQRHVNFHSAVIKLHTDDVTPTGALGEEKLKRVENLWKKYIETD